MDGFKGQIFGAGCAEGKSGFARHAFFVALLANLALIAFIYGATLNYPFVFDDSAYVVGNHAITSLSNQWPPSGTRHVAFFTFALNYAYGALDPSGYRLVNIAIHFLNSLLVFSLVRLMFGALSQSWPSRVSERDVALIALFTSLLFSVHPVQTQAVTYVSQRFTSLASFFYLASIVSYLKWRTGCSMARWTFYAIALICGALAQFTKEVSFTLPAMIVFFEFAFFATDKAFDKRRILGLLPFLLMFLLVPLAILLGSVDAGQVSAHAELTDDHRTALLSNNFGLRIRYLITEFRVMVTYFGLLVAPISQNLDYDYPRYASFLSPAVFLSFILLVAIIACAMWVFVRSRVKKNSLLYLASIGVFWFFVTISVESSIIPLGDVIFEHRLYLPSVGAFVVFLSIVFCLKGRYSAHPKAALFIVAFLILLVSVFTLGANLRNRVWSDAYTLWSDNVVKSPAKSRVRNNLGMALLGRGDLLEAEIELREAARLEPKKALILTNLGNVLHQNGKEQEAVSLFLRAIDSDPEFALARYNLGLAYESRGDSESAMLEFSEAVRLDPGYPLARYNLGVMLARSGDLDSAMREFSETIRLKPDHAEAHNNLGAIYFNNGRVEEALREYEEAIRLKPSNARAHYNLAECLKSIGREEEAREHMETYSKLTGR